MTIRAGAWAGGLALALAFAPVRAQDIATDAVAVTFGLGEFINLDYVDEVIEFSGLKPDDQGWIEARHPDGSEDLAQLLITSNVNFSVGWRGGSPLANGAARLPLQFGLRLRGFGSVAGQQFNTGATWAPEWGAWLDCGDGGGPKGKISYEPGYRYGLAVRARLFRQGLLDAPGEYTQPVPMTFLVTSP